MHPRIACLLSLLTITTGTSWDIQVCMVGSTYFCTDCQLCKREHPGTVLCQKIHFCSPTTAIESSRVVGSSSRQRYRWVVPLSLRTLPRLREGPSLSLLARIFVIHLRSLPARSRASIVST